MTLKGCNLHLIINFKYAIFRYDCNAQTHLQMLFLFKMNFKVFLLVHNESLYIQKANAIERNSSFLVSIPYITSYQKKTGIINFFMLPYLNGAV